MVNDDPIVTSLDQVIDQGFMNMTIEDIFWGNFSKSLLDWSIKNKIPLKYSQFSSLQSSMLDFARKQTDNWQKSAQDEERKWKSMPIDFTGIIGTQEEAEVYICYLETFWPFTSKTIYPDRHNIETELDKLCENDHLKRVWKKHTKTSLPNEIRYEICRALQYLLIMNQRQDRQGGFGPNITHIRDTLRMYEFLIYGSRYRHCKKKLEEFSRKELLAIWYIIGNSFSGLC